MIKYIHIKNNNMLLNLIKNIVNQVVVKYNWFWCGKNKY